MHLYRSVAGRTADDQLRERNDEFGRKTAEHVTKLETLISCAGGDPQFVSASARATERQPAHCSSPRTSFPGSVDPFTAELAMLEAVMLAETQDWANWMLLAELSGQMPDGSMRGKFETVIAEVLVEEEEHSTWAASTRAALLLALAVDTRTADDAEIGVNS